MSDDLFENLAPNPGEGVDPVELARRDLKKHLPRRFWKETKCVVRDGLHHLELDGRPAFTPARKPLAFADAALAEALRAEWDAVGETVDPAQMPLTRMVNSALDGVANEMAAVAAETAKYAGSDALCYRADGPERLSALQTAQWDPLLEWAREQWGARFNLGAGVMFVDQPAETIDAIRRCADEVKSPLRLAALHVMTTLTGSVLLALAVQQGRLSPEEAWALAHLDEDFQMEVWGQDEEALARRAARWREMQAAALLSQSTD
jgi:chaperone required for assembly of F1-ATPase